MGEVAERSEVGGGLPAFYRKAGSFAYLQSKYADSSVMHRANRENAKYEKCL